MRDFDEHNPRVRLIFSLVMLLVVIGGLWIAAGFIWPEDNGQITILKADNSPYKVKPDDKGGMQIPHQDKLIFNTVSSEGKMVTVERILPGPEQPLNAAPSNSEIPVPTPVTVTPPTSPADAPKAPEKPADKAVDKTPEKTAPLPTPAAKIDAPVNVAAMGRKVEAEPAVPTTQPAKPAAAFDGTKGDVEKPILPPPQKEVPDKADKDDPSQLFIKEEPAKDTAKDAGKDNSRDEVEATPDAGPKSKARVKVVEASPDDSDAAEPPKKQAEAKPAETKLNGKGRFQIASFFDKESADKGLAQFKAKYADALQGASLGIVTATINGGKQVWRVQGSASSADDAGQICADIKAKGGTCVTVK